MHKSDRKTQAKIRASRFTFENSGKQQRLTTFELMILFTGVLFHSFIHRQQFYISFIFLSVFEPLKRKHFTISHFTRFLLYLDGFVLCAFFRNFGLFYFWRLSFLYFFLSFFMFHLPEFEHKRNIIYTITKLQSTTDLILCDLIHWYSTCKAMRGNVRCVLYHVPCTVYSVHGMRSERHSVYHTVAHNSHLCK